MDVRELNKEQLDELRETYFYQLLESDDDVLEGIDYPSQIDDEMLFNHFSGISFVNDDFSCSVDED